MDLVSRTRRVKRKPRVKKYMPVKWRRTKQRRTVMNFRIAMSVGFRTKGGVEAFELVGFEAVCISSASLVLVASREGDDGMTTEGRKKRL